MRAEQYVKEVLHYTTNILASLFLHCQRDNSSTGENCAFIVGLESFSDIFSKHKDKMCVHTCVSIVTIVTNTCI